MTDTAEAAVNDGPEASDPLAGHRVVARTILRPDQELDIRPLYVGGISGATAPDAASAKKHDDDDEEVDDVDRATRRTTSRGRRTTTTTMRRGRRGPRRVRQHLRDAAAIVKPEKRMTFGTYFNAFPASYWRRWTDFEQVRLVMRVSGTGLASSSTARPPRATSSAPSRR